MHKKIIIAFTLAAATCSTSSFAQEGGGARPAPVCPPSGFHPPLFGVFGGNDGIQHPYEVVSPCAPPEVVKALEAMGLGRSRPMSTKAVMSVHFAATGAWVDPVAGPVKLDSIDWQTHFYYPGARVQINGTLRNGKKFSNTEVFNADRAWDETTPGVGPKAAPRNALAERMVWPKLLPQGAMLSIVEAQGTVKVSKDAAGKTVISGKSPYEPFTVTITLNDKSQIEKVVVPSGGRTYTATFMNYNPMTQAYDPKANPWEPAYLVPWPSQIVWTKDNKPYGDFQTTAFKSNAYMVFPYPELLKAEAEEADPTYGYDKNDKSDPRNDPANQFSPDMNLGTGTVKDVTISPGN